MVSFEAGSNLLLRFFCHRSRLFQGFAEQLSVGPKVTPLVPRRKAPYATFERGKWSGPLACFSYIPGQGIFRAHGPP